MLEDFKCRGCGACCRIKDGICRVSETEIARIAEFLGRSVDSFIAEDTEVAPDRKSLMLKSRADGACAFLSEDNRCLIHPVKPDKCRTFPYEWTNADSHTVCPELQSRFPPIDFAVPEEDEYGRYALLTGVGPEDPAASPYEQTFSAFVNLERRLADAGMDFSNVVRTWLYGADILDWYPELNRARKDFFDSRGTFDRFVPASTGIGWDSGTGAKIVTGAFAVKPKAPGAVTVEALPSPLQCPALEYGSSFSRAAEVRTEAWRRVIVSGTASIEPGSHAVAHVGDVDAQIECTLRAVAAIYESRGLSLSDVTGALVYLKEERFRAAWERWLARHPEFPRAHSRAIVADVCRPDWLFEIESDATATPSAGTVFMV